MDATRRATTELDKEIARTRVSLPEQGQWEGAVPAFDKETGPYWQHLSEHRMSILRCQACKNWIHPPLVACPECQSTDLKFEPIAGTGTVYTYTISFVAFGVGIKTPYVLALVDLDEQPSLRIVTNIVNSELGDVTFGMKVRVVYYDANPEVTLPFFEPVGQEVPA